MVVWGQASPNKKNNGYRVNLVVKRVAVNYPMMLPLRVGVSIEMLDYCVARHVSDKPPNLFGGN